jgi:hypothetical protein
MWRWRGRNLSARLVGVMAMLAVVSTAQSASADAMLDQVAHAVDGAESSHGNDQ